MTSNAILLVFYCSPLTTVLEVLRNKSSASLHLPLSVMTIINGTLWVAYGLVRALLHSNPSHPCFRALDRAMDIQLEHSWQWLRGCLVVGQRAGGRAGGLQCRADKVERG